MVKIPKIKKKISAFLTKEDGKISRENLVKVGVLFSVAAMAALKTVHADCPPEALGDSVTTHNEHCNDLSLRYADETASGTHQHGHGQHGSHGSHGSHTSADPPCGHCSGW